MMRSDKLQFTHLCTAGLAFVLWSNLMPAAAQEELDEAIETVTAAETAEESRADEQDPPKGKSLDELLGLDEEDDDAAREAATRDAEEELEQKLDEQEAAGMFAEAVTKMRLSADLLDQEFEAGLGTQRVQEEIIRKLEQIIDFAKQQQSGSSSFSNSSSQQQQQSQEQQPDQQPTPQNRENQPSPQRGSESQDGDPPPMMQGDALDSSLMEETGSEWGHLPERIRNQLIQGRSDTFSSLYEKMTNEYYRRLAEEGS